MTIYLLEKSVMGGSRCLLAGDVYMFLQKNMVLQVHDELIILCKISELLYISLPFTATDPASAEDRCVPHLSQNWLHRGEPSTLPPAASRW